ncbi:hypothetical protein RKD55_001467 [Rossellomorea marisflavi]
MKKPFRFKIGMVFLCSNIYKNENEEEDRMWSVPFRCRRLLSAGRKSSLLSCASGVSSCPHFPQESNAFRFNPLCDFRWVSPCRKHPSIQPVADGRFFISFCEKKDEIEFSPFLSAADACFPRGGSRSSSAALPGSRGFLYSRRSQAPSASIHSVIFDGVSP